MPGVVALCSGAEGQVGSLQVPQRRWAGLHSSGAAHQVACAAGAATHHGIVPAGVIDKVDGAPQPAVCRQQRRQLHHEQRGHINVLEEYAEVYLPKRDRLVGCAAGVPAVGKGRKCAALLVAGVHRRSALAARKDPAVRAEVVHAARQRVVENPGQRPARASRPKALIAAVKTHHPGGLVEHALLQRPGAALVGVRAIPQPAPRLNDQNKPHACVYGGHGGDEPLDGHTLEARLLRAVARLRLRDAEGVEPHVVATGTACGQRRAVQLQEGQVDAAADGAAVTLHHLQLPRCRIVPAAADSGRLQQSFLGCGVAHREWPAAGQGTEHARRGEQESGANAAAVSHLAQKHPVVSAAKPAQHGTVDEQHSQQCGRQQRC
mmetsp:Transcript_45260/g.114599  ORF Transcript_45260/g.114599 Transcript_45260/m.114599 type:complete len:377 (-) Transcript_45260:196-1326(-)